MSKHKHVKDILINWDFVIASPDDGIIMGEPVWFNTEETRPTGDNMKNDNLPAFQYNLDVAVGRCFHSKNSWVSGLRFSENGIVVNIHVNDDVDDHVVLPYDCVDMSIDAITDTIKSLLDLRNKEKKKADKRLEAEEADERSIYERLRKKFEKVE